MNISELVASLERAEVHLWLKAGSLHFRAPAGAITTELLSALKRYKKELVALLHDPTYANGLRQLRLSRDVVTPPNEAPVIDARYLRRRLTGDLRTDIENRVVILKTGLLNIDAFRIAFDEVANHHDVLRASLIQRQDQWKFRWCRKNEAPFEHIASVGEPRDRLQLLYELLWRQFPLQGPFFRAFALQLSSSKYVYGVIASHLIVDEIATEILADELGSSYDAQLGNRRTHVQDNSPQYFDYVKAITSLPQLYFDVQGVHWERMLKCRVQTSLPSRKEVPNGEVTEPNLISLELSEECEALRRVAHGYGVSLFAVLLTIHHIALYRMTSARCLSVGIVQTGRDHPQLRRMIGCFLNTPYLTVILPAEPSFQSALEVTWKGLSNIYKVPLLPIDAVRYRVSVPTHSCLTPVINFVPFRSSRVRLNGSQGLVGEALQTPPPPQWTTSSSEVAYRLSMLERSNGLTFWLKHSSSMYDDDSVAKKFMAAFGQILRDVSRAN